MSSPVLSEAREYAKHGISIEGLEAFIAGLEGTLTAETTTSTVCHSLIKPATAPAGWVDVAELILRDGEGNDDGERRGKQVDRSDLVAAPTEVLDGNGLEGRDDRGVHRELE